MDIIGIDLGTTNSFCVTYRGNKVELILNAFNEFLTPSAVWIKDDEVIVGKIARQRLVSDPAHTASLFKCAIGTNKLYELDNKKFTPSQLSSFVVKQLIHDAELYDTETKTGVNLEYDDVVLVQRKEKTTYYLGLNQDGTWYLSDLQGNVLEQLEEAPSLSNDLEVVEY